MSWGFTLGGRRTGWTALHSRRFSEPVTVHRTHADGTVYPTLIITTKEAYDALMQAGPPVANSSWQAALRHDALKPVVHQYCLRLFLLHPVARVFNEVAAQQSPMPLGASDRRPRGARTCDGASDARRWHRLSYPDHHQ